MVKITMLEMWKQLESWKLKNVEMLTCRNLKCWKVICISFSEWCDFLNISTCLVFSTFNSSRLQHFQHFSFQLFNFSSVLNISTLEQPNLSSILVPGVVDRWAVDWWWHKYCLYSFPVKVENRKAFKRSLETPQRTNWPQKNPKSEPGNQKCVWCAAFVLCWGYRLGSVVTCVVAEVRGIPVAAILGMNLSNAPQRIRRLGGDRVRIDSRGLCAEKFGWRWRRFGVRGWLFPIQGGRPSG